MVIGVALAALILAAGTAPVLDAILHDLNAARVERGSGTIARGEVLDGVAGERARETAALPEGARFASKAPIDDLLAKAGIKRYRSAIQYLAYQSGYTDPAAAAVRNWKGYAVAWEQAMERRWTDVGLGAARASDGTLVIAVVFIEKEGAPVDPAALEAGIAAGIDAERARLGLGPLARDEALDAVARAHSADMARRGFFAHVSPEGTGPGDRMTRAGIAFARVAENISRSLRSEDPVADAVQGWMDSPGHRANIVQPAFTRTGIGVAVREDDGEIFTTQVFLTPPPARADDEENRP